MTREEVYRLIDGEREYQNSLVRNEVKDQRPMEQLALIRYLCSQLDSEWYNKPGHPSMAFFRQIAGVAVRCMEEHGAPARGK